MLVTIEGCNMMVIFYEEGRRYRFYAPPTFYMDGG